MKVYCDQCEKQIGERSLAYFSDEEKDLDFCSENCQLEWKSWDWEDIHPNFTPHLQKLWKHHGFTAEEVKKWINKSLTLNDYDFANYLKRNNYNSEQELNLTGLRKEHQNNLDWTDIHKNFGGVFGEQKKWEKQNFTYQQTKSWIEVGFTPGDYKVAKRWKKHGFDYQTTKKWKETLGESFTIKDFAFCVWLRDEKHLTAREVQQQSNLEELKKEYNKLWTDIHEDFAKLAYTSYNNDWGSNKTTCQQAWEEKGFTYPEAKQWIENGFKPNDVFSSFSDKVSPWKKEEFTPQQAKSWIEAGLELEEAKIASYLRRENYQPDNLPKTIEELRKEYNQNWLNNKYPDKQEKEIKTDNSEKLYGSLVISDYPQLEKIEISNQQKLIQLQINNCPNLKELTVSCSHKLTNPDLTELTNLEKLYLCDNSLTNLDLTNNKKLKELNISGNQLTNLNFNHLKDLEALNINDNNLTNLSIESCVNLKKLDCWSNQLTKLNLSNNLKLEDLRISDNNFSEQDLSFLSHLVNLKSLGLGNDQFAKFDQGIYNRFRGSLKLLQKMSELERLDISNTDLDSGLECLPESVKRFNCSVDQRKDAKVKVVEEEYEYFNKDLKKYREFINSSAQKWLDENYPENDLCKRRKEGLNSNEKKDIGWDRTSGWWINSDKKRSKIVSLDISNENLEGELRLKGFIKLKRLNCSNNQLTDLDLNGCPNLIELKCDNNKLTDLNFLKAFPSLEKLWMQNNPNLVAKNLESLSYLTNLKELDLSGCSSKELKGSLKSLENSKLEKVSISRTNISEGLESLPKSCKELNCELDYDYSSVKIAKQLSKFSKEGKCNLDKWRIDKANNKTVFAIPLERLFVIRSNLKQFLRKWGKEYEESWYEKPFSKKGEKSTELSKLRNPDEINTYWYVGESGQWIARGAALTGGILAATTDPLAGGILAASSPVVEVFATQMKEKLYQAKQNKWDRFLEEVDSFLDNYNELLGLIKKVGSDDSKLGKVNKSLRNLDKKTKEFLNDYDTDGNGEVDVNEIKKKEKREKLAQDLVKGEEESRAWAIVEAIRDLEDIVVKYQKDGSLIEDKKEETQTESKDQKEIKLYQEIEKEVEKIKKKELDKELSRPKTELEIQSNKYQQIQDQLDNLLFLEERKKLINNEEKSKLLGKLKEDLSKTEENINMERLRKKKKELEERKTNLENKNKDSQEEKLPTSEKKELLEEINQLKEIIEKLETESSAESWLEKGKRILFCGAKKKSSLKKRLNSNRKIAMEKLEDIKDDISKYSEQSSSEVIISEQKEWQNQNFTKEQTKQWIETGLTISEANFAAWLRDIKSKEIADYDDPQWVKTNADLNQLRKVYQQESQEVKIDMQAQILQPQPFVIPGPSKK
ncbi:leucine-rich repeat domain-containing protein [endosymbiont GvMRE of Glomus versiforme]|uniref:leucine-rich repeat domain-containing protein n=1 Tax=endosymbiont GvMRE of Glomus versiforme TaxID=2039283 RepID=UPI0011C49546|nr:leucine-rich repeat domain-containing protein [endosymbiont GvMRE of Glomus versiforme]